MRSSVGVVGLSALSAVSTLLVAGCGAVGGAEGGDGSAATAAAAVTRAVQTTEQVTSLRYRMTGRMPQEGRIEAQGAMATEPEPVMSLRTTVFGGPGKGTAEVRLIGGAVYWGSEEATEDGKHWIKFGAPGKSRTPGGLRVDTGPMAEKVRQNPAREAAFLTGADDLSKAGTETVEGVPTTHYRGTATLDEIRDAAKGQDKATRQRREQSLAQYEKQGVDELTMDVWIDDADRTRQVRLRGSGKGGPLDLTITLLDFGKPVTVQAPPASDTVDMAAKIKEAKEAARG
ncbi:LppX_LprAFG lipoprotein [Streptomyces sp. A012304]|uniref:LppX_LprAFG lipoprotein n=1 Tax=Streptomyces sp. A012304 TaxID=375446 RepID=UPI002230C680|nr:LppX_LprAFG lipoprotein [Streptomyces sp. A012304]GKQ35670.1 putative lipoprotein [Streptomyces sp. A012304]